MPDLSSLSLWDLLSVLAFAVVPPVVVASLGFGAFAFARAIRPLLAGRRWDGWVEPTASLRRWWWSARVASTAALLLAEGAMCLHGAYVIRMGGAAALPWVPRIPEAGMQLLDPVAGLGPVAAAVAFTALGLALVARWSSRRAELG